MNHVLPDPLSLTGVWRITTIDGNQFDAHQPGVIGDPAHPSGKLQLQRRVTLPHGDWVEAVLWLKGAKYRPVVRVEGQFAGRSDGGFAPIAVPLPPKLARPGATITIEIDLDSVTDVPPDDASMLALADRWRGDLSSGLWDDVNLHFNRGVRFCSVRTRTLFAEKRIALTVDWLAIRAKAVTLRASLLDGDSVVCGAAIPTDRSPAHLSLPFPASAKCWWPEGPHCYQLRVELVSEDGKILAEDERTFGLREFTVAGKGFRLNDKPFQARGGSIGWHRFRRDHEGRTFAHDRPWFETEIIARYKAHGANWFRPHLGLPPEWMLDLCDKYGLCVQVEWPPFHGLPCSRESLVAQLTAWIDHAERHPCCVLFHPWNETYDDAELAKGAAVIEELARTFPHLVWAHRDVLHAHRYWWSLFENLKLPFDSPEEFPQPIVVDEFGGNYLDGEGNPGGYPELPSAFLRFLGPGHTATQRLQLQCDASARIAEYWRRLGAAGVAQFCSLSSWEDGNHHFLGPLRDGKPKPVWQAMTAAWAPVSVSLDLWDRNFIRNSRTVFLIHFFNDTEQFRRLIAELRFIGEDGHQINSFRLEKNVGAWSREIEQLHLTLPAVSGAISVQCELLDAPIVGHRVISEWKIWLHTDIAQKPFALALTLDGQAPELAQFSRDLRASLRSDAALVLTGQAFWNRIENDDASARAQLESWLRAGRDVVLLDAGPSGYGIEAISDQPKPVSFTERRIPLVLGLTAIFRELVEGDSCFHATSEGEPLWTDLAPENTCLWNGMRGGMVISCWDMHFEGLHRDAFRQQWRERGADPAAIEQGGCFAYELAGFYAFSPTRNPETEKELRQRVEFLFADAPALHSRLNPKAPILCTDLNAEWKKCGGQARRISALACAGKNLRRTPLVLVEFGPGYGRLVVSQLITAGRLAAGHANPSYPEANPHYALRPDPAAQIFVRNLLALLER